MAFEDFAEQWEPKYPAMIGMWRRSWNEFVPFLDFPPDVRRLIYTTNGIESLNARFRAATRRRGHFPNEQSALKILYLTARERRPNRANPTGQINGWKSILWRVPQPGVCLVVDRCWPRWLPRPIPSLSGRRPGDCINELGRFRFKGLAAYPVPDPSHRSR